MKVNNLIIAFFAESPPCSAQTCPEMRASEWQYLCAVHDPPKSCCAIDYCCHTLDWATNTLTSPKYFASRLTLGSETGASMRHLTNIFRRLYRIFAHAWFQHRDVFWEVEGHDGLYVFFKTVCDMFRLIPEDNYTIPPEAEGPDAIQPHVEEQVDTKRLTILRKEAEGPFAGDLEGMDPSISTGATTRRHKHSPSTGSRVTTITESAEDHEEPSAAQPPLRSVMKDSPEPRPSSTVESRPKTPPAAETAAENTEPATEAAITEDIGEPGESAETTQPEPQPEDQPQEPANDTPAEPTEEKHEQPDVQEGERAPEKTEETTETPLEGGDAPTPSVDETPKEPEVSEPEPEPKAES